VAKLQAFLKDSQGLNVTVNGIFDQQTYNAVKDFQQKYLSDVMGPWGSTQTSGYVYITTEKKINELACNTSLTLSPEELTIINAYKSQQGQNGSNNTTGLVTPSNTTPSNSTVNSTTTPNASTTPPKSNEPQNLAFYSLVC
jgi:peptidoglycan hydrolase-like protein with peptidoglycan-binding domain